MKSCPNPEDARHYAMTLVGEIWAELPDTPDGQAQYWTDSLSGLILSFQRQNFYSSLDEYSRVSMAWLFARDWFNLHLSGAHWEPIDQINVLARLSRTLLRMVNWTTEEVDLHRAWTETVYRAIIYNAHNTDRLARGEY